MLRIMNTWDREWNLDGEIPLRGNFTGLRIPNFPSRVFPIARQIRESRKSRLSAYRNRKRDSRDLVSRERELLV